MKILCVVGARPNFMKIAPIMAAMRNRPQCDHMKSLLVHTGQHYDRRMSQLFFEELEMPSPDVNLEVGSASHAVQTAEIMKRFEVLCLETRPTHVLVVGDVNSTIACALVAVKLGIRVVHVEAGLRSFDRSMPEEINRILTDAISDILFTTEQSAGENLLREGISQEKIHFVGNVMIDTLLRHRSRADGCTILQDLGLKDGTAPEAYAVLTIHRPATVEDSVVFQGVLEAVFEISKELPIVFPVHPRTQARIAEFGFQRFFRQAGALQKSSSGRYGIITLEPLGYLEFLKLMSDARVVLTDSGGIQEETTILGVPCVTIRNSTERPVTVTQGTNMIAGTETTGIVKKTMSQMEKSQSSHGSKNDRHPATVPPLWDGHAAERIVEILYRYGRRTAS